MDMFAEVFAFQEIDRLTDRFRGKALRGLHIMIYIGSPRVIQICDGCAIFEFPYFAYNFFFLLFFHHHLLLLLLRLLLRHLLLGPRRLSRYVTLVVSVSPCVYKRVACAGLGSYHGPWLSACGGDWA